MKTLVGLLLLSAPQAFAQHGTESASSKSVLVQASGCVSKAVESSCLVLKDSKTGELYNLLFADHAASAGTAIRFQGTEHQGMTSCIQGKAVNVTKWKRIKDENCPAAQPEASH